MTTYAELIAGAAEQIRLGAAPLRTDPFKNANQAMAAIGDFHAVLDAIASHTRRLLWVTQIQRAGRSSYREGPPPVQNSAMYLASAIESLTGDPRPHPPRLPRRSTPWLRAALQLRAASDLIATHFRLDGGPSTPDAAVTDTRALDAGLVALGHMTVTHLSAEEPLALRAHQARLNTGVITSRLPGLTHLARTIAAHIDSADAAVLSPLPTLPQTWGPIRTDDPVHELADRMHRIRQITYNIVAKPGDALATLRDVTTIGVAIHAHAAAFHGAQPSSAPDPDPAARGTGALVLRGRAWQTLHRDLSQFATLAPPHVSVRDDVVALARLLPRLAPLAARTNTAAGASTPERRVGAGFNGALAAMVDIGDHSAEAFEALVRSGTLLFDARHLPGDVVTDDVDLVEARLHGGYVRPPEAVTATILATYDVVRAHPVSTLHPAAQVGPTEVEREVAAISRT